MTDKPSVSKVRNLHGEDYLSGLGILIGGLLMLSASWAKESIAEQLIENGGQCILMFLVVWIIAKMFRG